MAITTLPRLLGVAFASFLISSHQYDVDILYMFHRYRCIVVNVTRFCLYNHVTSLRLNLIIDVSIYYSLILIL